MAISNGQNVRTAFGRPISSRVEDTTGLRWMFLLVVLAGFVGARMVASGLDLNLQDGVDGAARALGYGEPRRIVSGYVPGESREADPAAASAALNAAPAALAPAPLVAPTVASTAVSQPTPTAPSANTVRVVNTDGLGVVLHSAPRREARVPRGFLEGAKLIVLERSGDQWAKVRGADGQEGWVSAQYLAPAE
jgi:hypothetical protein